jgi:hypothetical protein
MAKKPVYETAAFKKLQAEWYGNLKASGFHDLEVTESDCVIRPQLFVTKTSQHEVGHNFHELCQNILREFEFKRPIDREIFELHAEGKSLLDIEKYLEVNSLRKLKKDAINDIIKKTKNMYIKGRG